MGRYLGGVARYEVAGRMDTSRFPSHDEGCQRPFALPRNRPCHCRIFPPTCPPGFRKSSAYSTAAPPPACCNSCSAPCSHADDAPLLPGSAPLESATLSARPTTLSAAPADAPTLSPTACSAASCCRSCACVPGDHLLFALDDTPTPRYGPYVQGAGLHHNPSPGPAGEKLVYGHLWVTLAWAVRHPLAAALCLPLRALLYVLRQGRTQAGQGLRLDLPHQAGTGRRTGPLADGLAGTHWQGSVDRRRRRLRQAALPAAGIGVGPGRV